MSYSAVILKNNKNKILLQLRDNNPKIESPNMWAIFGGGIKENESPIKGAIREIKEELGININEDNLKLFKNFNLKEDKVYFFKTNNSPNIKDIILNEGQEARYFSKSEILKLDNIVALHRKILKDFFENPN